MQLNLKNVVGLFMCSFRVWQKTVPEHSILENTDDAQIKKKRKVKHETTEEKTMENISNISEIKLCSNGTFDLKEDSEAHRNSEAAKEIRNGNATFNNTNTDEESVSRDNSVGRSSVQSFKVMSSIGALMASLKSSATLDDSFVNKTRRKRVRKHKRSKEATKLSNGSLDTTNEVTPVHTTKLTNKASPLVHLRFSDEVVVESPVVDIPDEQPPVYNYSALKDEDFLKYPVMQSTLPRKGDLISFKV